MSEIRGNKGEWSELYVFLKVLAEGKLYGSDEFLNLNEDIFYNILKVIRTEKFNGTYDYNRSGAVICIVDMDKSFQLEIDVSEFIYYSNFLLKHIKEIQGRGNNRIPEIESFLKSIKIKKLTADNDTKSDITIQVRDSFTSSEPVLDFSIKSQLGSAPTLLNASGATNFRYELSKRLDPKEVNRINQLKGGPSVRLKELIDKGITLNFKECVNDNFKFNLQMIDYKMPNIIADLLLYSNINQITKLDEVYKTSYIPDNDMLDLTIHKVKQLLMNAALGMMPSKRWDGDDEATGGYIVVKKDGELACFHIYNRNALKKYLFLNTKLENGSQGRHGFGKIYTEHNKNYFNLNLQIRFIK